MPIPPFETTFAVPLSCDACITDVSTSLHALAGISTVTADLAQQIVSVKGTAPPSALVAAIQATGRAAILRGAGSSNSAAVCILETHAPHVEDPVRGLVRMVQVAPGVTVVDLTVRGLEPGVYGATVRERGDISRGAESTGGRWDGPVRRGEEEEEEEEEEKGPGRGLLGGVVVVEEKGVGSLFDEWRVEVWELVGRSVVVARREREEEEEEEEGRFERGDPDTLVGVIARSAGVWDNDKTVCSCSGKTVWEEREEQTGRGML